MGGRSTKLDKGETAVMNHASGSFEVKMSPQVQEDGIGDPSIGRMALDKQFHGGFEATSRGQMLAAMTDVEELGIKPNPLTLFRILPPEGAGAEFPRRR
jgi:hypothetical protein